MSAVVDVLNYYDTADGTCPTDTLGSTCSFNFGPDLVLSVTALFDSLTVNPLGGDFVEVVTTFKSSGPVDVTLVDPSDTTTVLKGKFVAGTFNGSPAPALSTSVVYNTSTGAAVGAPPVNALGFVHVDGTTPYASLFLDDYIALNFASVDDFDDGSGGGLDDILAASIGAGELVDFTAEVNGQAYSTASGNFVPEPGTLVLMASASIGLLVAGRRRS
jgi:hypothetical protein